MSSVSRRVFLKGACSAVAALSFPAMGRGTALAEVGPAREGPTFPSVDALAGPLTRALARGGDYADLYLESRVRTDIRVVSSEVESVEYGILQGGGVRTVHGEKVGYAYAESLDPAQLAEVANTAALIAEGAPGNAARLVEVPFPRHLEHRESIEEASIAEKIALLERVDTAARAVSGDIRQVTIDYSDAVQRFLVAASTGELAQDELPLIYLRVTVTATRNGGAAEGSYRLSHRAGMEQLVGDTPQGAGREAAQMAVRMLDAVPAPTGEMPVVVAAGGGVMFHEAVGHGLEADYMLRGGSVFANRLGEPVASPLVTLYDDSTLPGARGTFNVDDEATPAAKTLLIERGRLVGYMQERRTARLMGVKPTANGRRQSFRHPVLVRMTNTNVSPGAEDPEDVVRSTKRGIYAVNFGGGQVDTASGQFTFGLREAYLIEDGKVTTPIRGANLVGSGIEVLERIDLVASDFGAWPGTCGKGDQWAPVTSGCPTLRISRMTIGGTA
jgi:TldD protein